MSTLNRIAVICPSRERASRIGACVKAFYETSSGLADLFVCVDNNDPELDRYGPAMGGQGILLVGQPKRCCPKLNEVWSLVQNYGVIGFIGDDCCFRTAGWDETLLNRFGELNNKAIIYPDDGHHHGNHPTHWFYSSNIPKALGYFVQPDLLHLFCDNVIAEIGRATGLLHYFPDILVEHMHYSAGKAKDDKTYNWGNSKESWDKGERVFNEWRMNGGLAADVAKIMGEKQ
jgi:hypothetical protein